MLQSPGPAATEAWVPYSQRSTARESTDTRRPSPAKKKKQCVETEDKNIFQYCVEDRSSIDYSVVVLGNHFKMKFQASEFYD